MWLLAWSPAVLILVLAVPLLVPVPFEDSWAFIRQYRDWCVGAYGWQEFMAPHNNHPSVPGKLIYWAVLHFAGGDVAILPVLGWIFSLGIALSVYSLARPYWEGNEVKGAVLMFCVNLTVFSAAAGHAWTWDFVFQNFIAGTCFAGGLALLGKPGCTPLRFAGAALLSAMGTFSFGSGFIGGVMLTPLVWTCGIAKTPGKRLVATGAWFVLTLAVAWLALEGFGDATKTGGEGSRVGFLLGQPVLLAQFSLTLLGYGLGNGFALDPMYMCPLAGLAVAGVFVACVVRLVQRQADRALLVSALPWVMMALYGMGQAAVITYGRMRHSIISALACRYVVFTLFFLLGTVVLVFLLARKDEEKGWLRKVMRRVAGPVFGIFLAAQGASWIWGYQYMRRDHERMLQEAAMLGFTGIVPPEANAHWLMPGDKEVVGILAKFLHEKEALNDVTFVKSDKVSEMAKAPELTAKWAWFDAPAWEDGVLHLHGACGLSKDLVSLPDGVVISAQPAGGEERIVAVAEPEIPFDFYEHEWLRRLHSGHYFGWTRTLTPALLPAGRVTLRAYTYDAESRKVRPMTGVHEVDVPQP